MALAAFLKLVKRGEIKTGERVVVISTAHGLKFTGFKRQYHGRKIEGMACRYANDIVELPNEYDTVRDAVLRKLDLRKEFRLEGF